MSAPKWTDYVEESEDGVRECLEAWDAEGLKVLRLQIHPVSGEKDRFRIYSNDIVGPRGKKGILLVDKGS